MLAHITFIHVLKLKVMLSTQPIAICVYGQNVSDMFPWMSDHVSVYACIAGVCVTCLCFCVFVCENNVRMGVRFSW